MPFFALLVHLALESEIMSYDVAQAISRGQWPRVEEYRRRLGSFRHPMSPTDRQNGTDLLSELARFGNAPDRYGNALKGVRLAIAGGADPNALDGRPVMAHASADRYGKMLARLLQAGGDPNLSGRKLKMSALAAAVQSRIRGNVAQLLTARADPNAVSLMDGTFWIGKRLPRDPAAREGAAQTRYAFKVEPMAPLAIAARLGDAPVVTLLLARKAKVDGRDPVRGRTALHEAAETDRAEIVARLLRAGASRAARDKSGRTPLALARAAKATAAVRALGG